MPELIDRWAALDKMCHDCKSGYDGHCPHPFGMCNEYESIMQVPTIEAEPMRHGRWIFAGEETMHDGWTYRKHKCSKCGFSTVEAINFCQKCGARMDGGADNG